MSKFDAFMSVVFERSKVKSEKSDHKKIVDKNAKVRQRQRNKI